MCLEINVLVGVLLFSGHNNYIFLGRSFFSFIQIEHIFLETTLYNNNISHYCKQKKIKWKINNTHRSILTETRYKYIRKEHSGVNIKLYEQFLFYSWYLWRKRFQKGPLSFKCQHRKRIDTILNVRLHIIYHLLPVEPYRHV